MPSMYGPMTLGEILDVLKGVVDPPRDYYRMHEKDERFVHFDWCDFNPGNVGSYRGFYECLAIEPDGDSAVGISDFYTMLEECIGKKFHGYKGGEYTMDRDTAVWVASWGKATGWGISRVELQYHYRQDAEDYEVYGVTLHTRHYDV
jgi:hypothetical protein